MNKEELEHLQGCDNLDRDMFRLSEEHLKPLREYIATGRLPGAFLQAVLKNDLRDAAARADLFNRRRLWDYVQFLYQEAPMHCWGSPELVMKYSERKTGNAANTS